MHAKEAVPNYLRYCLYTGNKTLAQRSDDVTHFLAAEMTSAALRFGQSRQNDRTRQGSERGQGRRSARGIYLRGGDALLVDHARHSGSAREAQLDAGSSGPGTGNLAKPFDLNKTMIDTGAREKALALAGK